MNIPESLKRQTDSAEASADLNPTRVDSGSSRRKFLQFVAAAGVGAMIPAAKLLSQVGTGTAASKGRIDVHHHLLPPFYVKIMQQDIIDSGRPLQAWSPEMSLDIMDKNGIATALLSPQNHLVGDSLSDKSDRARTLARQNNEYAAQLAKDHAGRFGFFAATPLPDQDAALKEIEYSLDTLKADGIGLWTSYRDKWPGDKAFAAAFDELNRRKAVVFFHPTAALCCRNIIPGVTDNVEEYDFDTTRAITSLLSSGTFDRCPDIRYIFCHSGGTMPMIANRVSEYFPVKKPANPAEPTAGLRDEFKQIYFDVAHAGYDIPISAITKIVPASHLMFGSDYPIFNPSVTINPLNLDGLTPADIQAINRGNAERLFPRFKS
jgi:6-methylsalicylate decarboxylase